MFIQNTFTKLSVWAARSPLISLSIVLMFSVLLSLGLTRLEVDVSNDAMFDKDDPSSIAYREFQKKFGRDDIVVAAIASDDIFSSGFMERLSAFHIDLEQSVPWLEDVTSLSNVDWIAANGDGLDVGELGKKWPKNGVLPDSIKADILSSSLYQGSLISADGKMTLVALRSVAFVSPDARKNANMKIAKGSSAAPAEELTLVEKIIKQHDKFDAYLAGEEYVEPQPKTKSSEDTFFETENIAELNEVSPAEVALDGSPQGLNSVQLNNFIDTIQTVVDRHNDEKDFKILLTGGPIIDKAHHDAIHADVIVLFLFALLVIIIALAILLRTWLAVIIPMIVITLSVLTTLGLMGWLGIPVTVISQALPPLLITAGVLDSVHLLSIYYRKRKAGMETQAAIASTFEHASVAVFYTSLTTAAGFISFTIAKLQPVSDFGWMSAFGVMIAMLFSFLLVPSLLAIFSKKNSTNRNAYISERLATILVPLAKFGIKNKRMVLGGVVVLVIVGLPGIFKLTYSHDVLNWFENNADIKLETMQVDNEMGGTVPLEFVIDSKTKNGILTPEFMSKLYEFQMYAENLDTPSVRVGRASSIVNSLQRVHSQLDVNALPNSIPNSDQLISQEIILYESGGAKEIARLTDSSYSLARVTVRLEWTDARDYVEIRVLLIDKAKAIFGDIATVSASGTVDLLSVGVVDVIKSMVSSYILATLLIGGMLIVLLNRFGFGIACLIPNFLPIYLALACMGYLGIPIDMFTVLLGGIALGLAVDDTVHLTNTIFSKLKNTNFSIEKSVVTSIEEIGAALLVTTTVMSVGFLTFSFSTIAPLSMLGILLSLIMVIALICDAIIVPALVGLFEAKSEAQQVEQELV